MKQCLECRGIVAELVRGRCQACRLKMVDDDEPTEAELEATIAEQSANLPDWWFDEDPNKPD